MALVTKMVRLKFLAPVSLDSLEEDIIHSFTLWGALVSAGFKIGLGEALVDASLSDQLYISSAFPLVVQGEEEIFYLPKPLSWNFFSFSDSEYREHYKSIKTFKKRNLLPIHWIKEIRSKDSLLKKIQEELKKKYEITTGEIPKVSLDRATGTSNLYYWTLSHIGPDTFFYFLVKTTPELWNRAVLPSLKLLAEDGIGAKKSWGYGRFSFSISELPSVFEESSGASSFLVISAFLPRNRSSLLYWDLGYISSSYSLVFSRGLNLFRPAITFYREGSILREEDAGRILSLKSLYEAKGRYYPEEAPDVFIYLKPFLLRFMDFHEAK